MKSAGAEDRAAAATQALQAAERDLAGARNLVAGKTRAEQELSTFYDKVLPADLPSARRLTYATLPSLARKSNVKFIDRRSDVEPIKKDSQLGILKIDTSGRATTRACAVSSTSSKARRPSSSSTTSRWPNPIRASRWSCR